MADGKEKTVLGLNQVSSNPYQQFASTFRDIETMLSNRRQHLTTAKALAKAQKDLLSAMNFAQSQGRLVDPTAMV